MRLLLVEDDDHVAAALSAILKKHGFDVTHARNGEEALQAVLPAATRPAAGSGTAAPAAPGTGAGTGAVAATGAGAAHAAGAGTGHAQSTAAGTGAAGPAAGSRTGRGPFDVVLLDLGLPDQDGYQVCGRIRKLTTTPVIMVTARADVRSRIHGLNLGADDYVVKPYDPGELLARIHAVSRRTATGGPGTGGATGTGADGEGATGAAATAEAPLRLGQVVIELPTRRVSVDGAAVQLTRKEFDLLALLAQRPGVVFRREQIISEVWRTSWEGTGRTLEVHVASLRSKLRMPALIETVRGVGYRLVAPAGPATPAT
ncbi:response regulator transcription factor [Streptomyces sp. NPDC051310]|uniref:response regulator transcription factor n=1 Tax=Streptomyces sp. NPDC051310 TaxID=3365649 RepID=UPI003789EEEF